MRACAFVLLAGLVGLSAGCKDKKTDEGGGGGGGGDLQGKWTISKIDFPASAQDKIPPGELDKMMKGIEITVKDKLITATKSGESKAGHAILATDSSKSPATFDLTEADEKGAPKPGKDYKFNPATKKAEITDRAPDKILGIYKLEGSTLTVAVAIGKDAPRPTEFKPSGGAKGAMSGVVVVTLQKK